MGWEQSKGQLPAGSLVHLRGAALLERLGPYGGPEAGPSLRGGHRTGPLHMLGLELNSPTLPKSPHRSPHTPNLPPTSSPLLGGMQRSFPGPMTGGVLYKSWEMDRRRPMRVQPT
jgi:hypothetical protein